MNEKKIVVIGGGTGNFTVLRGLKDYNVSLSAIVTMADDGGSTGILRDELGVLPPGDVRQCLVALSNSSELMRNLINYRFENGGLQGHSFGNLLLSALEKVTGSFEHAVEEVGKILAIKGNVIPVTTKEVRLKMHLSDGKTLEGEKEIYLSKEIDKGYQSIELHPHPEVNPKAVEEIIDADCIVLGPGGMHTSLIPNLLVNGMKEALHAAKGKKVFVCNLMNRKGQTTGYKVSHYVEEVSRYLGGDIFDAILVNDKKPPEELIEAYAREGDLVQNDMKGDLRVQEADLLGAIDHAKKGDLLQRNLIRHNPYKLAAEILSITNQIASI